MAGRRGGGEPRGQGPVDLLVILPAGKVEILPPAVHSGEPGPRHFVQERRHFIRPDGIRGENGALCLRPQLLPEQFDVRNRTSIILKFGGKAFKIVYTLLERLEPSEYTIVKAELDNMPIADGRILPSEMGALDKEKIHIVEAWLGRKVQ